MYPEEKKNTGLCPSTEETVLYVKGVSEPVTIYVIADSHMKLYDGTDHPYVRNYLDFITEWFRENWGRTDTADPVDIFEEQIKMISNEAPHMTVFVGDILCGPTKRGIAKVAEACSKLEDYMYVPGNHDWQIVDHREASRKTLEATYTPPGREEALENFREIVTPEEFAFQVREINGLLLVGMDDSENRISAGQLECFKEVLALGKPVILFLHVPVYTEGLKAAYAGWSITGMPEELVAAAPERVREEIMPTKETVEFMKLLSRPDTPVKAVFAGHVHFSHEAPLENGMMQYALDMSINGTVRKITIMEDEQ